MFLCWKYQYCENDYTTQIYQRLHYSNIQCNPYQTTNSIFHRTGTKIFTICLNSVQLLSHIWLFASPWTAARQASQSITNSWSPPKPMSIELVMPSNHLILCCPLLLLSSIFPSIRVFSNEMHSLHQVAKVLEFKLQHDSFHCTPGLISLGRNGWISLQSKGLSRVFSNTIVQKHQFFCVQLSL